MYVIMLYNYKNENIPKEKTVKEPSDSAKI